MENIMVIDSNSSKPKYEQIVDAIIASIENGKLRRGQQLPSIAGLASKQRLSKATVAKSYEALCERGIIISKHGKGFYVSRTSVKTDLNIFLLFDTFNQYKEILYKAFTDALPPTSRYNIFFHHYNLKVFESVIKDNIGKYTHYVIVPHFRENVSELINQIPNNKLLVLDQQVRGLNNGVSTIYQPFRKNVIDALTIAKGLLKKYRALHLVLGKSHFQYVPQEIISGFKQFVKNEGLKYSIEDDMEQGLIHKNEAYLLFSDMDMIRFVKNVDFAGLKIGKDVGLISYDDTPLKEILLGGVSVISTDFHLMGTRAAEAILNKEVVHIENPGGFIKRKTL